jgi:nucleotide sugar dehydrogenase
MTIGFLGLNSKSLSFAILLEKLGNNCLIFDEDENNIYNLNNKVYLSSELELQSELSNSKKIFGSTTVTDVIKQSSTIFVFVDTLINSNNTIDTTKIFDVVQQFYLASHIEVDLYNKNFILSTVLNVGDCKKINEKISQFGIRFGYLPNFLSEEKTYNSLISNQLYILGTNSYELSHEITNLIRSTQKNSNIYVMSFEAAELSKLAVSSIISYKIVVSNLIGDLMNSIGLEKEIPIVLSSISDDVRIGKQFMKYGMSFGGPNLGKELKVLSQFVKNKNVKVDIFESTELANDEHLEFLKYYLLTKNPDKSNPFVLDSLGYKRNSKILEDSPRFKLCIELLEEGYIINVIEDLEISKKFVELSDSFENKLKFFKRGSNPNGFKINF